MNITKQKLYNRLCKISSDAGKTHYLNRKENIQLKDTIIEYSKNIPGLTNRILQQTYHYCFDLKSIPIADNGLIYGFKNFKDGYFPPNIVSSLYKINIQDIHDENILLPILQNMQYCTKYLANPIVISVILNNTQFLPSNIDIEIRYHYLNRKIQTPLYCKSCNKLLVSFRGESSLSYCGQKCENAIHFTTDLDIKKYIFSMIDSPSKRSIFSLSIKIKNSKQLQQYILKETKNIFNLSDGVHMLQRCYHIRYNYFKIPKCKHCGKSLINKFSTNVFAYSSTCSRHCNNKYIGNIEKRLKNNKTNINGYKLNVGKNEETIISKIEEAENKKLSRNSKISKYFPDAVDKENKIIYEINEPYHLSRKKLKYDIKKYKKYIELGYNISIIWDNIKLNTQNKHKIKILKRIFKNNLCNGFFNSPNTKILTDTGFQIADGITRQKTPNGYLLELIGENNTIKCTTNHILYTKDGKISSGDIKIGMELLTLDGLEKIKQINKIQYNDYVYDIVEVKDGNTFYANNFLVHNCLIIDEAAAIAPNLFDAFWKAIYPVISSSKESSVIMVSTPRGIGNFFYETYETARLQNSKEGWKSFRIDWWDVPGRDEEWKQEQMAAFGGNANDFAREFGNSFLGSSQTLIKAEYISKYKEFSIGEDWFEPEYTGFDVSDYKFRQWFKPEKGHTYIIGGDVADGIGSDYSIALVFDVTNLRELKQVASFGSNTISTMEFPYILASMATLYNNAHIAIESNNMGRSILDSLILNYDYDNIVHYGGKRGIGIHSSQPIKTEACRWLRDLCEFKDIPMKIYDKDLISEIEYFEKHPSKNSKYDKYEAVGAKHDDYVISWCWAMFALQYKIADSIFDTSGVITNQYMVTVPEKLKSFDSEYFMEFNEPKTSAVQSLQKIDSIYQNLTQGVDFAPPAEVLPDDMPQHLGFGFEDEGSYIDADWSGDTWL